MGSELGSNQGYRTRQRYAVRVDRYQDGDIIRCEAQRPGIASSKRVSLNLTLDVRYEPVFTSCNTSYIFVENVTAELSCTAWAKPEPTISWSRGVQPGQVSVTNHRYRSVVKFKKISRTDSGIYTVRASNSLGTGKEKTVNVTVYFGPDSVQLRPDSGQSGNTVTVTENNNVTFTCTSGESNPAVVLSWYNNSSPVSAGEISEVSSQRGSNHGYLTTQRYAVRVDRYQDGDVIRCEAQRPGIASSKRVSANLTLDVTCKALP
ncbi:peroxidasin homolog [Liolophura sinensis]|uniref:peroxidasin homolog n=1 Tax=Liolophura sinensis TaxID=3198878 RepID=UPI00315947F9